MRGRLAIALFATLAVATAWADEADDRFQAASRDATTDPARALAEFEALGTARPVTIWTDNAWEEAARLAEAAGDFERARRDYQHAIEDGTDPAVIRRSRASLDRLALSGGSQWDEVTRQYDKLRSELPAGDPHAAMAQLETLVRANAAYPRANDIRLDLSRAHALEGETTEAIAWARDAVAVAGDAPGQVARIELVRTLIRARYLSDAEAELAAMANNPRVDGDTRVDLGRLLGEAERREWGRRVAWLLLALIVGAAMWLARRATGSWRATARAFIRPPTELLFLAPFAAVFVAVAASGNPLVAHAVISIAMGGLGIAWISGSLLAARGSRQIALHILATLVAVSCVAYLSVEHRVLDLLLETWRGGHALP